MDFTIAQLIFLIFLIIIVPYTFFWGIKKLRYSLRPMAIGMKTAPLGCATNLILFLLSRSLPVSLLPGLLLMIAEIAVGLVVLCKMTVFFFNKAKAWQEAHPDEGNQSPPEYKIKPQFGTGIFLYIFSVLVTIPLVGYLFRTGGLPFLSDILRFFI